MQATVTKATIDGGAVRLRHSIDPSRLAPIVESMRASGWEGRPVVVYLVDADNQWYANVTGCHRISAAQVTDTPVEAIVITPLDDEALDLLEVAAASDDIDASIALRAIDRELADVVEAG